MPTEALTELGALSPRLVAPPPAARSRALVETLAEAECPALTARRARRQEQSGAPQDPIVWARARGANVEDVDGNVYVDLTAGFGVAAIGHTHPRVVAAVRAQAERLVHALGDVHPSDVKIALLARLRTLVPFDARVILGLSGADAIDAALKTAMLATKRAGVLAFEGGYHGLALGPLAACGYKEAFRRPFAAHLSPHVGFAPFPDAHATLDDAIADVAAAWDAMGEPVGAVLVEPIQARGGVRVPPRGFLAALGALCRERGALLVADEIYTGLCRTGATLGSVADGAQPDLVCVGKALGGGQPVSACLGRADVMRAWGDPAGEALHTGTFFGHPLGCAAALASLDVIDDEQLVARATERGQRFVSALAEHGVHDVRGRGMLLGVVVGDGARTLRVVEKLLARGFLTLPAGASAEVLQLSPQVALPDALIDASARAIAEVLAEERG